MEQIRRVCPTFGKSVQMYNLKYPTSILCPIKCFLITI